MFSLYYVAACCLCGMSAYRPQCIELILCNNKSIHKDPIIRVSVLVIITNILLKLNRRIMHTHLGIQNKDYSCIATIEVSRDLVTMDSQIRHL